MDKSAQIRQLLAEHPDLSPKEIQDELGRRGVEVSRNLCKVVRHRELHGKKPKRTSRSESPPDLRYGERHVSQAGIVRLGQEDLEIWDRLKAYAESMADPSSEIHEYDGGSFPRLPEVRAWIGSVSTKKSRQRRQAILEQFLEDLRRLYPPPQVHGFMREQTTGIKIELRPITPSPPRRGRILHDAVAVETDTIWETVKIFVERHNHMLDLFYDSEMLDYLLSLETWQRPVALKAITNSYSISSALDDLLELAWSSTKQIDLPKTLKQLHKYNGGRSSASDGEWRDHPEISQLLFLLALWIERRIEISRPDQDGYSRIMIDKLHA